MSNPFTTKDSLFDIINQVVLGEKKLTDAELKKREEIAQAMERDNPGMDMSKKMAIATDKAIDVAEEVEQIDEASYNKDSEHHRNARKAAKSMGGKATYHPNGHASVSFQDVVHGRSTVNPKGTVLSTGEEDAKRAAKSHGGKAVGNVVHFKEEVEQIDKAGGNLDEHLENFWEAYTTMFNEAEDQQQNMLLRAMAKDPSDLMKMKRAIKMGDKALTNPALRQEILKMLDQMMTLTTGDKSLLQRTRMGFQKAKTMKMPEEVQLEAMGDKSKSKSATHIVDKPGHTLHGKKVSVNSSLPHNHHDGGGAHTIIRHDDTHRVATIGADYLKVIGEAIGAKDKQDEGEYGYEGDMAMSQLRTIIRNCQEMMKVLDKETDMPEWVQSKITLATDYLQTANDYLMSELEEEFELDEADEKEVGKEIKAARLKKDSSEFMSKSSLYSAGARDVAKHLGKKDDEKYGEAMRKVKDTPVSKFVASRKGDGKVRIDEVETAPFDGGRPVKSKESAAVRVKKIAKGMEKLNTPKKDKK